MVVVLSVLHAIYIYITFFTGQQTYDDLTEHDALM